MTPKIPPFIKKRMKDLNPHTKPLPEPFYRQIAGVLSITTLALFSFLVGTLTTDPTQILTFAKIERVEAKTHQEELTPFQKSTREKIIEKAQEICNKKYMPDYCYKDLTAMAWKETTFNCNNPHKPTVGDNGESHGCFQIHTGYNKNVTPEQAEDLDFAINWTLNRMIHFGYYNDREYAIMRHNGSAYTQTTLTYLRKINNYIVTSL